MSTRKSSAQTLNAIVKGSKPQQNAKAQPKQEIQPVDMKPMKLPPAEAASGILLDIFPNYNLEERNEIIEFILTEHAKSMNAARQSTIDHLHRVNDARDCLRRIAIESGKAIEEGNTPKH